MTAPTLVRVPVLFGPYRRLDGTPAQGLVGHVTLDRKVTTTDGAAVLHSVQRIETGPDGTATVDLPALDQDGVYAGGFLYRMTWRGGSRYGLIDHSFAVRTTDEAPIRYELLTRVQGAGPIVVPVAGRAEDVTASRDAALAAQQAAQQALAAADAAEVDAANAGDDAASARAAAARAAADAAAAAYATMTGDPRMTDRRAPLPQSVDDPAIVDGRLLLLPAERVKLDGVAVAATRNAPDEQLRDRATHTGQQPPTSIADLREFVEDTVGGMLRAVGVDLDISYDDASGTLSVDYTGNPNDPESIRDAIGAALVGVGNVSVLVNDAADTITITTAATVNATNAELRDRATHTGVQPAATIGDFDAAAWLAVADEVAVAVVNARTTVTVGSTTTGAAGTAAAVVNAGTPTAADLRFTIPKGDTGATGAKGDPGDLTPATLTTVATASTSGLTTAHLPSTRVYILGANWGFTLPTPSGGVSGTITLVLRQAATGGPYTVTWPATGITWAGGAPAPAMPTTANARLEVHLFWTGQEWLGKVGGIYP